MDLGVPWFLIAVVSRSEEVHDMRSRVWLIPLMRAVLSAADDDARRLSGRPPLPEVLDDSAAFDRWLGEQLAGRGYNRGLLLDALVAFDAEDHDARYDEFALLNHTAHKLDLGRALLWSATSPDPIADPTRLLAMLAFAVGADALGARALALPRPDDPEDRAFVKGLNAIAGELGQALVQDALPPDHPLLGHPFHQLLQLVDATRFGRVARLLAAGAPADLGPDPSDLLRAHGIARSTLHQAISASIGLAVADGIVEPTEKALIEALMQAARFDDAELAMHAAEFLDPATPAEIAGELGSDPARRFLFHVLFLAAHVNGRYHDAERAFIEQLAAATGESAEALDRFEARALATYESQPDLVDQLSLGGTVRRLRRHLTGRLDKAVRKNAKRLWREIEETGELMHLLVEAGRRDLTQEEDLAVRKQLVDVCKAVPALALFAVPGGSILLPLVLKHLPFNMLPSSFVEEAEIGPAGEPSG